MPRTKFLRKIEDWMIKESMEFVIKKLEGVIRFNQYIIDDVTSDAWSKRLAKKCKKENQRFQLVIDYLNTVLNKD